MNNRRINIISKDEPQTTVKLGDGTIIKIQTIVFSVLAMYEYDGSRKLNLNGSPIYGINAQQMMYVDTFKTVPDNTKRN